MLAGKVVKVDSVQTEPPFVASASALPPYGVAVGVVDSQGGIRIAFRLTRKAAEGLRDDLIGKGGQDEHFVEYTLRPDDVIIAVTTHDIFAPTAPVILTG
jgi:hypothetical protein